MTEQSRFVFATLLQPWSVLDMMIIGYIYNNKSEFSRDNRGARNKAVVHNSQVLQEWNLCQICVIFFLQYGIWLF